MKGLRTTLANSRVGVRAIRTIGLHHRLRVSGLAVLMRAVCQYVSEWRRYSALPGAERLRVEDAYPCLFDRTHATSFDAHYLYQEVWAVKRIAASGVTNHVDVGSRAVFVCVLTAFTNVTFIDLRPLMANCVGLTSIAGDIMALPFADRSVRSLSSLHVLEHIGLGRYGDVLNPRGTEKAARELARVLAPGGNLYVSLPVGVPRVCFNAHRIHSPQRILDYFAGLELTEFSGVDDHGNFKEQLDPMDLADCRYACGLFRFTKPASV